MKFHKTSIEGMILIEPRVLEDERGFFMETFHAGRFAEAGINLSFPQDNHSHSSRNVLRGLHYQLRFPQGKLVRVFHGSIFDVGTDIRRGSPTFGSWEGHVLSGENRLMLYLPPGLAHGFCVLSDEVDCLYKCTDVYHPEDEFGLIWNDPTVKIEWPISDPIISERDAAFKDFDNIEMPEFSA